MVVKRRYEEEERKKMSVYYLENKEKIRAKQKKYYDENKDRKWKGKVYRINPNTKKYKENMRKIEKLDEKIEIIKKEMERVKKCINCGVEFYNMDGSKREKCWSCIKGVKEESQPKILREGGK